MKAINSIRALCAAYLAIFSVAAMAEQATDQMADKEVNSLDGLLQQVQAFTNNESDINNQREQRFIAAQQDQQQLLKDAKKVLAAEQKRAEQLKASFDENEEALTERSEELRLRIGNLGEMFGVVRQVSDDLNGLLHNSLTIVEKPQRAADLDKLSQAKELPNIQELKELWFVLQEEMTMSGQIATFEAPVIQLDGTEKNESVTRVGVFNAVNQNGYLRFDEETGRLIAMTKQPAESSLIDDYLDSNEVSSPLALDPTRGALLGLG